MRITPARTALLVLVFTAALVAALLVLRSGGGDEPGAASGKGGDPAPAATSDIWAVGDEWTVTVRQDSAAITPGGETSVAKVPFRFAVTGAPKHADDTWKLHVTQDGAEGPFAKGWRLEYRDDEGTMVLHRVAMGDEPALEANLAAIVLGAQFPYETSYEAPPKDKTVDARALLDRTSLPPSAVPGADAPDAGATPPADAPALAPGATPPGAPGE